MTWCDRCERHFPHDRAFDQHRRDHWAHWMCWSCDRDFRSEAALHQHWKNSSLHEWCDSCEEVFDSWDEIQDHYEEDHYYCRECNEFFSSRDDRQAHFTLHHWFCIECSRQFISLNNIKAHLNSALHKPRTVVCPGRGCGKKFLSIADMFAHFEADVCPSGMTRKELKRLVVERDRNHIITNPNRLIGYDVNSTANTQTCATDLSWNGSAYECFMCHNTFRLLRDLNRHLQSSVHEASIFRCPNLNCRKEFKMLSALTRHVESDSCGVQRFKQVQDAMNDLIGGIRRIGI